MSKKKEVVYNNIAVVYGGTIVQKNCCIFATDHNLETVLQEYESWYDDITFVACKSEKSVEELQNLLNASVTALTKRGKNTFVISISDAKDLAKAVTGANTCNTISEKVVKNAVAKTEVADAKPAVIKPESKAIVQQTIITENVVNETVTLAVPVKTGRGRKPKNATVETTNAIVTQPTIETKNTIVAQPTITKTNIVDDDVIPGLSISKNPNVEIVATTLTGVLPTETVDKVKKPKKNKQVIVPP